MRLAKSREKSNFFVCEFLLPSFLRLSVSLSLFPLLKKTHESRYSSRRNQKRRPKNEERRTGNWNGKLFTTQQNRKKTQAHTRYLPLLLLLFLIPRGSSRKMN